MTETNAYGPGNSGDDYIRKPTSSGRCVPVMDVKIAAEDGTALPVGAVGEICFRGPMLIRGYWNRPEATAETIVDGWLRSGDLGRLDEEGFIYVEDRAKDMVIRAGENIYCAEVEAAIYDHPAVYEAAVFGIPHERLGEELVASRLPEARRDPRRRGAPGPRPGAPGRVQGAVAGAVRRRPAAPRGHGQDPQTRAARHARRPGSGRGLSRADRARVSPEPPGPVRRWSPRWAPARRPSAGPPPRAAAPGWCVVRATRCW